MNERIKRLAIEADFDLYEDGNFHSHPPGQWINANLEKFAELIVRECADLLETSLPYNPQQKMIKKHFGVEE